MRAGAIAILAVLSAPALSVGYCNGYNYWLESEINKMRAGQTKDDVVKRLGSPSWEDTCFNPKHNIYGYGLPGLKARCAQEFGYRTAFGGLPDGSYYLVWFNADGKVIRTGEIHSP
jgi:hypothetical protein